MVKRKKKPSPKQAAQSARLAERREKALYLRKGGATFREIAATLRQEPGISKGYNEASAHEDVAYELRRLNERLSEGAEEVRRLELERLDRMLSHLDEGIEGGDDKAVNAALRIMERRAKLLGLDAPTKIAPTTPDGKESVGGVLMVPAPVDPSGWDQVARETQASLKEEKRG